MNLQPSGLTLSPDFTQESADEVQAAKFDLNYVHLDGETPGLLFGGPGSLCFICQSIFRVVVSSWRFCVGRSVTVSMLSKGILAAW